MNQEMLDRVLRSPRLPSLPSIALEVIDLVQQQDVNIKQIAHTISHDPAMASKILKTVNSSFYGQTQQISTISHALVILGLNSVKTLALGFSLVANLKDQCSSGFDHLVFWKRSLYAAAGARTLARELNLIQQEEAFLAGLLQDLGILAMSQALGNDYAELMAEVGKNFARLAPLERGRLDLDHAQVGGALARQWKLPNILTQSIEFHEDVAAASEEMEQIVRCVSLGASIADVYISDEPGVALEKYLTQAEQWFGWDKSQAEPLLMTSHKHSLEMRRLFDLPTGMMDNSEEILARANEALLQISLQQQQKSTQLEQENHKLVVQATTDSLTGVANRRRFNEFIAEQFDLTGPGRPMSLLFFDTDHFKKFNDTYGHQTGDRVLVELASLVSRTMPKPALVSRYGGEEFAVVLPGMDRITAARLAERTRQRVAEAQVESDEGELLSITVSIGVASHDGTFFEQADQLIKAADQGVYAAKASGRNCVRVFTPRPKMQQAG